MEHHWVHKARKLPWREGETEAFRAQGSGKRAARAGNVGIWMEGSQYLQLFSIAAYISKSSLNQTLVSS